MGDDSSKNNNQIYCLINFFVFALSRKNNKQKNRKGRTKIKKGNIPSGSVIELLLTLFLGTSGSLSRQSSRMNDILKKGLLQKKFLFTKVSASKKKSTASK